MMKAGSFTFGLHYFKNRKKLDIYIQRYGKLHTFVGQSKSLI